MQTKLRSLPEYEQKSSKNDCIWLLKEIKAIMNHFDGTKYIFVSLDTAKEEYYSYRQGPTQNLDHYYKTFKANVDVLEHYGANIGGDNAFLTEVEKSMITPIPTNQTSPSYLADLQLYQNTRNKLARNKTLAISFLKRADTQRFGALWIELQNQFSRVLI